nr:glycosyltransferase family 4 protein [Allochromatium humboldtianum]
MHLTPHFGGGVGRALSSLTQAHCGNASEIKHSFICLEPPQKTQFLHEIQAHGGQVTICPSLEELHRQVSDSDILQVEWWNHPLLFKILCTASLPAHRLLVWCHVSGLYSPRIPIRLLENAHRFIFTSVCSWRAEEVQKLSADIKARLAVVSSGAALDWLPEPIIDDREPLRAGYLGTLDFNKLHPEFVDYLAAVRLPDFQVRLIGDTTQRDALIEYCRNIGCDERILNFRGYVENVVSELSDLNVLIYLLNPEHYGTAENALLEAMAMGLVPVVLNNPAETAIVEHGATGLIVNHRHAFADALDWLSKNPAERSSLAARASVTVRQRFTLKNLSNEMMKNYKIILCQPKKLVDFQSFFGTQSFEWFLSCQPKSFLADQKKSLKENHPTPSKGSILHFLKHFPEDSKLKNWLKQN